MKKKINSLLLVFIFILVPIMNLNIKIKAEKAAISVEVVVNSHNKMMAKGKSDKSNALEALKDVLNKNKIEIDIQEYDWGK